MTGMDEMHRDDFYDVNRHITTIGFQHHLTAATRRLPDVCGPPCGHWIFTDELDLLRTKPRTHRWERGSEITSHLFMTLREVRVARVRSGREPDPGSGWF